MARAVKLNPTLDSLFFVTPEQKLLRFLLTESTTTFTLRVLASKLKGVRGLGGAEGMTRILRDLEQLGMVQFTNNERSVCLQNEHSAVKIFKSVSALCDLEGLAAQMAPLSSKGILYGSRAAGKSRTDSNYDLFVVSDRADEIRKLADGHPLGRQLEILVWREDEYPLIERKDSSLANRLSSGIVLWGSTW